MATTEYHPSASLNLNAPSSITDSSETIDRLKRKIEGYKQHGVSKSMQHEPWTNSQFVQERNSAEALRSKWMDQKNSTSQRKPVVRRENDHQRNNVQFNNKLKRKLDSSQLQNAGQTPTAKPSNVPSTMPSSSSVSVSVVQQINSGENNTIETRLTIQTDTTPRGTAHSTPVNMPTSQMHCNSPMLSDDNFIDDVINKIPEYMTDKLFQDLNHELNKPPPAYPHDNLPTSSSSSMSYSTHSSISYDNSNMSDMVYSSSNSNINNGNDGQIIHQNAPQGPAAETLKQLAAQHHCNDSQLSLGHPPYSQNSSTISGPPQSPHYYQQNPYAKHYSTAPLDISQHPQSQPQADQRKMYSDSMQPITDMQNNTVHMSSSQHVHINSGPHNQNIQMRQQMAMRHQMYSQQQVPPQQLYNHQQQQMEQQRLFYMQQQAMRQVYFQNRPASRPPYTQQMRFPRPPNGMPPGPDWQQRSTGYMNQSMGMRTQMLPDSSFDSIPPTEDAFIDDLLSSKGPS